MDESSDPFSIPWWIWIVGIGGLLAGLVIFALKYQRPDDEQYRPYRGDRTNGRRSRRGRHRSRSRDRP